MSHPTLVQQRAFFETFGFLKLPRLLRDDLAAITTEFEAVFPQLGRKHDGAKTTSIVPFVDQRARLCALLDHLGILEAAGNLLGSDFNYVSSDGNYYTGDTGWHRDSLYRSNSYLKVAFYLDRVTRDTGCLRVIPGSNRDEVMETWNDQQLRASPGEWGVDQRDLPAFPIESEPGDVLIFNHHLLHASFGGSARRRMFTMNLGRRAKTSAEMDELISYISWHIRTHCPLAPYGKAMVETASPTRQVHLTQVPEYWNAACEHYKLRTAK